MVTSTLVIRAYTKAWYGANKIAETQKVHVADYISFSLFGVVFILVGGGTIIILSLILGPITSCLRKRRGYRPYANLEWTSNETLQLQRLAHEGIGLGAWSGTTETVPVTERGEHLGVLDISNPAHPKLRGCSPSLEEEFEESEVKEEKGQEQQIEII